MKFCNSQDSANFSDSGVCRIYVNNYTRQIILKQILRASLRLSMIRAKLILHRQIGPMSNPTYRYTSHESRLTALLVGSLVVRKLILEHPFGIGILFTRPPVAEELEPKSAVPYRHLPSSNRSRSFLVFELLYNKSESTNSHLTFIIIFTIRSVVGQHWGLT
jgi:hypothetical protein